MIGLAAKGQPGQPRYLSTMVLSVTHTNCGLYIVAIRPGNEQLVVNSLTGEEIAITRTHRMIMDWTYYQVGFNHQGWA